MVSNGLEKLKQDLVETQREVADLGGLKTQIVSLARPLEKMEATLKDLSGVVESVEEEVGKGKKERCGRWSFIESFIVCLHGIFN